MARSGGLIGTEYLAFSKPDGYTFLFASSGPMSTLPAIRKKLSFDPLTAFTPLYGMASSPLVMVVAAEKPTKTLKEFVDYARKNPGRLNFASLGTGTAQHLTGELFIMRTGTEITHIPYKATPAALSDVMSGTIDFMWDFAVIVKPLIDAGKLRPLAVSSRTRLSSLPEVPTAAEAGFPDIVFDAWYTVVMPKGVAKDVSDKFIAAFAETMKDSDLLKYFEDTGSQSLPSMTQDQLQEFFASETQKMKAIIEQANIQPTD